MGIIGRILDGCLGEWIWRKLNGDEEVWSSSDSGKMCPHCGVEMKREYFSTPGTKDGPRGTRWVCLECGYKKNEFVRRGP